MKIRKLLLVEPKAPARHVYSLVRLPRLGLPILGTLAARRGIDAKVVIEQQTPLQPAWIEQADLVGISTITSTAPRAYQLADQARAAGVPVIMGGPHVSFLPNEALEHADWVLRGEGEDSFGTLLEVIEGKGDPRTVPGLSYRHRDGVAHNDLPDAPVDMDRVPLADFSLLAGRRRRYDFDLGVIPMQTSRGCPHNCNFCSVTPMFGHRPRYMSNERVAEELQRRRGRGNSVFFYDDNFCASPRRTKSLLEYLLRREVFLPPWMTQVSVRAARDRQMLQLMRRAGCFRVFVGLESINPGSLEQFHKQQTVEDIRLAVERFHDHGIQVHGMFMLGADSDSAATIRATSNFVMSVGIDTVQFAVLTPLPGTPLFAQIRQSGRLLSSDWSLYDAHHVVFRPARMSAARLATETMRGMARVYSWRRILGLIGHGRLHLALLYLYARRQIKHWHRHNRQQETTGSSIPPATKLAAGDAAR